MYMYVILVTHPFENLGLHGSLYISLVYYSFSSTNTSIRRKTCNII